MAHDIFISYASPDKPTADAACAFLERHGVRCWVAPRDILSGVDWSEAIVEAIESCRIFVLIFSSCANGSPQIKREVERAVNKGKMIVPFRIENVVPTKALEYFISTPHWLDALTPPLEAHMSHLGETIRLLLERTAPKEDTLPLHFERSTASGAGAAPGSPQASGAATVSRVASEIRLRLALPPGFVKKLPEWEEAFLRALGPLFGGDRLAPGETPPRARLTALVALIVGGLGVAVGVWQFFGTLSPGRGTQEAYFFSIFPLSRWLNLAAQAFGVVVSLVLLAGAHRVSDEKPGGLAVLSAAARTGAIALVAWCLVTMATLVLSANWRRHLAASNRAEVTAATFKAAVLPLVGLGSVAYLAKRPQ